MLVKGSTARQNGDFSITDDVSYTWICTTNWLSPQYNSNSLDKTLVYYQQERPVWKQHIHPAVQLFSLRIHCRKNRIGDWILYFDYIKYNYDMVLKVRRIMPTKKPDNENGAPMMSTWSSTLPAQVTVMTTEDANGDEKVVILTTL